MSHLSKILTHISQTRAWFARHVFALALTFAYALVLPFQGCNSHRCGGFVVTHQHSWASISPHRIGDCDRVANPTSCYTIAKQVSLALFRTG